VRNLEVSVARSASASAVRVELNPVPSPRPGETAVRLGAQRRSGWLYVTDDAAWGPEALERVGATLGRLVDVALEREAVAEQAAETETARRADVAKTAVLHAISHDLRSPLTAITTAASGLRDPALDEADRAELVAVIEDETSRLSRLVDDLLDLSRIQAGAAEPRPDWCDLREAVANAAAQVARSHGPQQIVLALPQDLPLVRADPAQLERVFANLIENAARFSPPGEPVRVTGGTGGGSVTVRVIDRGPGVPPSRRSQVFEPFFRGGDPGGGSGLGLAIARGFVEANGGRIRLQAGTPGETAFAVSFPLVRQPVAAG
jgi:two-component system sensor histidine kinase KdpD